MVRDHVWFAIRIKHRATVAARIATIFTRLLSQLVIRWSAHPNCVWCECSKVLELRCHLVCSGRLSVPLIGPYSKSVPSETNIRKYQFVRILAGILTKCKTKTMTTMTKKSRHSNPSYCRHCHLACNNCHKLASLTYRAPRLAVCVRAPGLMRA